MHEFGHQLPCASRQGGWPQCPNTSTITSNTSITITKFSCILHHPWVSGPTTTITNASTTGITITTKTIYTINNSNNNTNTSNTTYITNITNYSFNYITWTFLLVHWRNHSILTVKLLAHITSCVYPYFYGTRLRELFLKWYPYIFLNMRYVKISAYFKDVLQCTPTNYITSTTSTKLCSKIIKTFFIQRCFIISIPKAQSRGYYHKEIIPEGELVSEA